MFDKVRKPGRAKNIIAYIIFGAICLVFVFFGIAPSDFGGSQGGAAAIVNGSVISMADFREQFERIQQQYQKQFENFPAELRRMQEQRMRAQVLQELVQYEMLYQSAKSEGIYAPDREVRDTIVNIPLFQENGQFRRERYDMFLQSRSTTSGEFEQRLRKDLIAGSFRRMMSDALTATPIEERFQRIGREAKASLEFFKYSSADLAKTIDVSAADIKALRSSPEGQAKIKEYYNTNISNFSTSDKLKASHILLKVENGADEKVDGQVYERATAIKAKLTKDNFAEVAKKESEDLVSAPKGGSLGYFNRGTMVLAFETEAFNMPIGSISDPVRSEFGYHIIYVEDKQPATSKKLEEVEEQIAKKVAAQDKAEKFKQRIEELAKNSPQQAWNELNKLGVKIDSVAPFSLNKRELPELGNDQRILEKALSLNPGDIYPQVIESQGKNYLVKLKSFTTPAAEAQQPEESNGDAIASMQAMDAFESWLKGFQEAAKIRMNSQLTSAQ